MDSSSLKHYHRDHFDAKTFLNTYFSTSSHKTMYKEVFLFPMHQLIKYLDSAHISGDTLIDCSVGPTIFHMLPICEHFKDIIILETSDACITEMEKWMNKEADAFDWSHASKVTKELKRPSHDLEEIEEDLRRRIKRILQYDFTKTNPAVVLQGADCVLSLFVLNAVSKDHDAYCQNLRQLSCMLKLGGHLLLFGAFHANHYMVGEHKFHKLNYDEVFIRKALGDTGFSIEHFETTKREEPNEFSNYEQVWFISAVKRREN
ncbi:nicotinamide N-methyltransferase-like [Pelodytes ibericus]